MVKKERKRKHTVDEKDTLFRVHDRHIPPAKIRRYKQSRGIGYDAILSPPAGNDSCSVVFTRLTSRTDTPAHITYSTPYGTPRSGQPPTPRDTGAQEDQSLENDQGLIDAGGPLRQAEENARGMDLDLPLEDLSSPSLLARAEMPIATEQHRTPDRYERNFSILSAPEKTSYPKNGYPRHQPQPLRAAEHIPSTEDEGPMAQAYAQIADVSFVDDLHIDHPLIDETAPESRPRRDLDLRDLTTPISSVSSYAGHGITHIGYDGPDKREFEQTLQETESLYDSLRSLVLGVANGTRSGHDRGTEQQTRGSGLIQPRQELSSIYNELLEGYEYLRWFAFSPRQPGIPDKSTTQPAIDPMAERWRHDTYNGNIYGLVRSKHIQSVLDLATIYLVNGAWESLPVLLTKLIFDLWLAKEADNGELVAAAQIVRTLSSLWSNESCTKDKKNHKYTKGEIVKAIFHRALIFSKKLNRSCSISAIQEALARVLDDAHGDGGEAQPIADGSLSEHPAWTKIMHFLFIATACFEPGREREFEESIQEEITWERLIKEPDYQQQWSQQTINCSPFDMCILNSKYLLCCSLILRRELIYVGDLLWKIVPELESLLPSNPDFVINALAELASRFARIGESDDAIKYYARAKIAQYRVFQNHDSCRRCNGRNTDKDKGLSKPRNDKLHRETHDALDRVRQTIYPETWMFRRRKPPVSSPTVKDYEIVYSNMLSALPEWLWQNDVLSLLSEDPPELREIRSASTSSTPMA